MCGLVGISGDLEYRDEDPMRKLLVLDWWRGKDSTGLAAIRNNGDVHIAKVASHPLDLFDMGKFRTTLTAASSCVFLGHNRAATRGGVTSFNAHPFQFRHIVGAHNGTLLDSSQKALQKAVGADYPVDSMAIIAAIAELGIEETVKLLDGSWAISYVNLKDGTVNFIRNKERPLWWAAADTGKQIYHASEWQMIQGATHGERDRKLWRDKDGCGYFQFAEDIHYSFSIDALKKGTKDKRPKPSCKKMEGKKSFLGATGGSAVGFHTGQHDPFKRKHNRQEPTIPTMTSLGSANDKEDSNPLKVMQLPGTDAEPYAGRITREKFEALSKYGCNFCHEPIPYGATGITVYTRDDCILCPEHSGHGSSGKVRIYESVVA